MTFDEYIGIEYPEGAGPITSTLAILPHHCNPTGAINGGVFLTMADNLSTGAANDGYFEKFGERKFMVGVDLHAVMLSNQQGGTIRAVSVPIRIGRRITVVRTQVFGTATSSSANSRRRTSRRSRPNVRQPGHAPLRHSLRDVRVDRLERILVEVDDMLGDALIRPSAGSGLSVELLVIHPDEGGDEPRASHQPLGHQALHRRCGGPRLITRLQYLPGVNRLVIDVVRDQRPQILALGTPVRGRQRNLVHWQRQQLVDYLSC